MGRIYKSKGRRRYKKYSPNRIQNAVQQMKDHNWSYREASDRLKIPKTVLFRHSKGNVRNQGGQTVLSDKEERMFIENINICSEWGYPIDTYDLRLLVKNYLDKQGRTVRRFKNNLPGKEFIWSFLHRHKRKISQRFCENIKRSRSNISREVVEIYFQNLEKSLADIPAANIINYDETNKEKMGNIYIFPNIPDLSEFTKEQVIRRLDKFTVRRGIYNFENLDTADFE